MLEPVLKNRYKKLDYCRDGLQEEHKYKLFTARGHFRTLRPDIFPLLCLATITQEYPPSQKGQNTSKYKNYEKIGLLLSTAVLSVWNSFNGTQENLPTGRSISKHIKIFSLYYVQTYLLATQLIGAS